MKLHVLDETAGRCTGACCRSFPLSFDPLLTGVEVIAALRGAQQRDEHGEPKLGLDGEPLMWNLTEGAAIADMVLPLYGPYPKDAKAQARFTCRHFDGSNCTNYENRPDLCRDHGVISNCHEPNCTFDILVFYRQRLQKYWPLREAMSDPEKTTRTWLAATVAWIREMESKVVTE